MEQRKCSKIAAAQSGAGGLQIDNKTFGAFVAQLRKERGLTQKELAQTVLVSDKAVSKWERGLSMPDIALLLPLGEALGVSTTELLRGARVDVAPAAHLPLAEVEQLVAGTIQLCAKDSAALRRRKIRGVVFACCLLVAGLEFRLLLALGFSLESMLNSVVLVEGLSLFFGGWLCLFVKETLPAYYDENKVTSFSDGIFRVNLTGTRFSNRNWPYILRAGRVWMLTVPVLYPILFVAVQRWLPSLWAVDGLFVTLAATVGGFVPMIVAAKRYE